MVPYHFKIQQQVILTTVHLPLLWLPLIPTAPFSLISSQAAFFHALAPTLFPLVLCTCSCLCLKPLSSSLLQSYVPFLGSRSITMSSLQLFDPQTRSFLPAHYMVLLTFPSFTALHLIVIL